MAEQRVVCSVFVPGRPRTKGSLKAMHQRGAGGKRCKVWLTEDHDASKPWMRDMIAALKRWQSEAAGLRRPVELKIDEPVEVHLFFRFERRVSDGPYTEGGVRPVWPSHDTPWPTAMDIGDEDKLRRNALDALTQSGVLADDRLSIGGSNYKRWCIPGETPGVQIFVATPKDRDDVLGIEEEWDRFAEESR